MIQQVGTKHELTRLMYDDDWHDLTEAYDLTVSPGFAAANQVVTLTRVTDELVM